MEQMDWRPHIALGAAPEVRGAGMSVEQVLAALSSGVSVETLVSQNPGLTRDKVLACLAFAAEQLNRARFVDSVRRGLDDTENGRVFSDEEVWAELDPED